MDEPLKMNSLVRDRAGDLWERGRTRWTCCAPVDGRRILRVARLPWSALVSWYGPVEVVRVGKHQPSDPEPDLIVEASQREAKAFEERLLRERRESYPTEDHNASVDFG
uniref:hypothetical protein n=1 Tax=Microbacterium proteolyticum TaxID=1572644 RepID=UPI002417F825|nr:hypothetical protein [Microbacterium proteolyticum]